MTANILVVDDVEANVKLLEAKLLSEYYTVFTAVNGKNALDVLIKNKIDIVLLDVMMPEMDGFETCKRIKSNPETTHIPVVMVTALSDVEDRVKGLEAGADEFLTKPIDDIALFARVRSLTRMKAVIDTLKLRNTTNAALGLSIIEMKDIFAEKKILLINDDVIQAKNIKTMLLKISPQIKIVNDYKTIKDDVNYTPDLVIISCQLEPNIDQPDYSDPLRISVMLKANIKNDLVIMLLTDEGNTSLIVRGMELGINDYFVYPIEENELLARIRTQLRRQQYQENLRNDLEQSIDMSVKDELTGLFNRRYFNMHIIQMTQKANENKRPLCMLMCDIDDFKHVNDTYGHQAGDTVLKTVTHVLKNIFKVTDLIARFGGEEFVILLNDTSLDRAIHVAERVRVKVECMEIILEGQNQPLKKTISIGVTEYNYGEDMTDFIERADKALYKAKETGKNRVEK